MLKMPAHAKKSTALSHGRPGSMASAQSSLEHMNGAGSVSIAGNLFRSSGMVFLFQVLGIVAGFFLQAFLSRTCGAAGLGGYTLFVSWLGILSILTVPGLEGTLVYYLPRYERDGGSRRKVVRVSLLTAGAISSISALALLAGGGRAFIWAGLPSSARVPFAFSILVFSLGRLLDSVFLGMKDASAAGYFNVIRTILRVFFCLPIFLLPRAWWILLFCAVAAESCITLLLRYRGIRENYLKLLGQGSVTGRETRLSGRMILMTALPMFGISIVDSLYPFLDKAILGAMLPLECVGIYGVAESVASLNSVFVSPFIAFWPYISKLYSEERLDELRDAYRSINLIIVVFMIPLTLILLEMSGYILSLFGNAFALRGRTALLILALGCVVDAVTGPAGAVLRMTRHSRLSLLINMLLLVAYIALSFMLVGKYGLLGIAAAKAAVMVMGNGANVIANYLLLRTFPYTWKHGLLLAFGMVLFAVSLLLPGSGSGIETHCAVALAEAAAFLGFAFIILGAQRKRMLEQFRSLLPAAWS